jgi:hypothetical protein
MLYNKFMAANPFQNQKMTRAFPRPLAELLETCLGPTLAAHGFASSDLMTAWSDIVGTRLAAYCEPLKLEWRSRGPRTNPDEEAATLTIRVESAFAIEVQHQAPILIERINAHYGWRCIARIMLKQAPVRRGRKKMQSLSVVPPKPLESMIGETICGIEHQNLKEALLKLRDGISKA